MPSPILARADALMQRRHLTTADSEEVPVLTDAVNIDDDIPVLIDIAAKPALEPSPVIPTTIAKTIAAAPPRLSVSNVASSVPAIDTDWGAALVEELGRRVEQRLLAEIPRIVAATVSELLAEQDTKAGDPQR